MVNEWNFLLRFPRFAYLREVEEDTERMWVGVFEQGMRSGAFRADVDPRMLYRMMRDAIWVSVRWFRADGPESPEQLADRYLDVWLQGIVAAMTDTKAGSSGDGAAFFDVSEIPWPAEEPAGAPNELVEEAKRLGARRKFLAQGEGGFYSQLSEFPAGYTVPMHTPRPPRAHRRPRRWVHDARRRSDAARRRLHGARRGLRVRLRRRRRRDDVHDHPNRGGDDEGHVTSGAWTMEIFDDLVAEEERLEEILAALDDIQWQSSSGAAGWTITDVVLHLAQSEEAVVASAVRGEAHTWRTASGTVDDAMDELVRAERSGPREVFERWKVARRAAVAALVDADPQVRLAWAAAPLKPATLATTRLAEHWAHGLDITGPLGIAYPDTDRLRHIAWLGHGSLPYAFTLAGEEPHDVHCELTAPDGQTVWRLGADDAESTITGSAGAFCRVGARRLAPDASGLVARGPHAAAALRVLRNYAG